LIHIVNDINKIYCVFYLLVFSFAAMLKKRIISFFLVLVFAIPVLPVMQVGCFLYQNQFTEEISAHGFSMVKKGEAAEQDICHAQLQLSSKSTSPAEKISIDEKLSSRQADDITTPPPNATLISHS
jgi:hypothetical protein